MLQLDGVNQELEAASAQHATPGAEGLNTCSPLKNLAVPQATLLGFGQETS